MLSAINCTKLVVASKGAAWPAPSIRCVLAVGIALDLELDPRLGADLLALLGRSVLADPFESRLARHISAAREAVELALLLGPGRGQARVLDVSGEGDGHLAARAGPGIGRRGGGSGHQPSVRAAQEG